MKTFRYLFSFLLLCIFSLTGAAERQETAAAGWRAAVQNDRMEITCTVAPGCTVDPASAEVRLNGRLLVNPPGTAGPHGRVYDASQIWRWQSGFTPPLTELEVTFQACRGDLCLPPETVDLLEKTAIVSAAASAGVPPTLSDALERWKTRAAGEGWMDAGHFSAWLQAALTEGCGPVAAAPPHRGFWALFWLILLGGLGLNLTPCVLPMIPVNLAIIGAGRDAPGVNGRPGWCGFRRGLAYGAGITLAYGILGGLAALGGASFGMLNSCWWFNLAVAGILLLLALSLLSPRGLDLSGLAGGWVDRVRALLPPWLGAFFLGAVAALLAGACVAPVVIGVVVLAAEFYAAGQPVGLLLPLALGAAMALPWPLAGAGLAILPEPGRWMIWVKRAFALLILLASGYFGWIAYRQIPTGGNPAEPLTALAGQLEEAAADPSPVLLKFSASWCKNCAAMAERTFPDPAVQTLLAEYQVRVIECRLEDLTAPANRALLARWKRQGLPAWVLLVPQR